MLRLDITDVANNVVSQVVSDPVPFLPRVQHCQTSPGHLAKYSLDLRLQSSSHLAKLCCFLEGQGPVECEGVTTGTNLVEAIAPAVYLVV